MPATETVADPVKLLAAELLASIREAAAASPPLLLDAEATQALAGLSKSAFYRLLSAGQFPAAVDVPGAGPRWRRADVERWASKLRTRR